MRRAQRRPRIARLLARPFRGAAWGLGDQALVSAANFVTLLVLARELEPHAFGAFALAYAALLLLNGLQTALITQPHNVLGQWKLRTAEYRPYTAATAVHQAIFALALACVILVAAGATSPFAAAAATVLGALAAALVAWQAHEFLRRVLYTERRLRAAFGLDLVGYGGQVLLLIVLSRLAELSAASALLVVGATSASAAAVGVSVTKISLTRRLGGSVLRENWRFGKWVGAAIAASWLVAQIYLYLVAIALGASDAGAMRAAQVVLGPVNAFLVFLAVFLPIHFAAVRRSGGDATFRTAVRRAFLLTTPPTLAACALTALFSQPLLEALFAGTYRDTGGLVALFALYYAVMHPVFVLTAALTACGRTKALFSGSAFAGVASLLLGWPVVALWGLEGAAAGMIAGALLVALLFWRTYHVLPVAPADEAEVATAGTRA